MLIHYKSLKYSRLLVPYVKQIEPPEIPDKAESTPLQKPPTQTPAIGPLNV